MYALYHLMRSKIKLIYRDPSFLEGVSRLFDIPGVLRDDVVVVSVRSGRRSRAKGSTQEQSQVRAGARAIDRSSTRVNKSMSHVAGRVRPVVTRRHQDAAVDRVSSASV